MQPEALFEAWTNPKGPDRFPRRHNRRFVNCVASILRGKFDQSTIEELLTLLRQPLLAERKVLEAMLHPAGITSADVGLVLDTCHFFAHPIKEKFDWSTGFQKRMSSLFDHFSAGDNSCPFDSLDSQGLATTALHVALAYAVLIGYQVPKPETHCYRLSEVAACLICLLQENIIESSDGLSARLCAMPLNGKLACYAVVTGPSVTTRLGVSTEAEARDPQRGKLTMLVPLMVSSFPFPDGVVDPHLQTFGLPAVLTALRDSAGSLCLAVEEPGVFPPVGVGRNVLHFPPEGS